VLKHGELRSTAIDDVSCGFDKSYVLKIFVCLISYFSYSIYLDSTLLLYVFRQRVQHFVKKVFLSLRICGSL